MLLLSAIGVTSGWTETAPAPTMRDAATNEELLLRYRKASQTQSASKPAPDTVTAAEAPKKVKPSRGILANSDVICFNGSATLVPKRAIIQIPKNMEDRLKYQPGAKLLSWSEFYTLNRAWITIVEVSMEQAEGQSPLSEDTQKKMVASGNLMLATYQKSPISVLPLKNPPETPTKTQKP